MNRKLTIYIVLLAVIIGFIVLVDASAPKPINWTPSYSVKDKTPLGLYIFDQETPELFKGQDIKKLTVTPYEYFDELYDYNTKTYKAKGTFLCISEENKIDAESVKELLYFADHGNTVFLSMKDFPKILKDTLKLSIGNDYTIKDSISLSLKEKITGSRYMFNEGVGLTYFDSIDTLSTRVLGHQELLKQKLPNYIQVSFGNGSFLLHTQPAAFSNFHLLKGNHYRYTEGVISYIPDGTIYWYSKQFGNGEGISGSPLRFILHQPALKWTMWLGIIAFLVFILFNAKRKQRIVPEITPLKNTTVDFAKTIGNLYYQEGDHHTIIEKKIIYFLEQVRNEYHIDTYSLDDVFIEKLHLKSGKPVEDIQKTVSLIKKHRHQFQSKEADVIEINKAIEKLRL
jgi:hypothetical protein